MKMKSNQLNIYRENDLCRATYIVSVRNTVGHQLELIITLSRHAHVRLAHKFSHVLGRIALALIQHKPVAEILQSLGLEARKTTVKHEGDNMGQLRAIRARGKECLHHQRLEPPVWLRVGRVVGATGQVDARVAALVVGWVMRSTHDGDHLGGQLERCALESHSTRCNIEAESKVNVDDMARIVDHDVSVMSVLELQQVRND